MVTAVHAASPADAIPPLVSMLGSSDVSTQSTAAVTLLEMLTVDASLGRGIFLAGILTHLVPMLSGSLAEHASLLLSELAGSRAIRGALMRPGENQEAVMSAIPHLLRMIRSSNEHDQTAAARLMWALAIDQPSARIAMVAAGLVTPTVVLLSSEVGSPLKRAALVALRNLAIGSPTHQQAIVQAGALAPLVLLLGRNNEDVVVCAAEVLAVLAEDASNWQSIAQQGAVAPLVSLLASSNLAIQSAAMTTLVNLGNTAANRHAIVHEGAILRMVSFLGTADSNLQLVSVAALHNLAIEPTLSRAIAEAEASTRLSSLMRRDETHTMVQRVAGAVLRQLANREAPSSEAGSEQPKLVRALEGRSLREAGETPKLFLTTSSAAAAAFERGGGVDARSISLKAAQGVPWRLACLVVLACIALCCFSRCLLRLSRRRAGVTTAKRRQRGRRKKTTHESTLATNCTRPPLPTSTASTSAACTAAARISNDRRRMLMYRWVGYGLVDMLVISWAWTTHQPHVGLAALVLFPPSFGMCVA